MDVTKHNSKAIVANIVDSKQNQLSFFYLVRQFGHHYNAFRYVPITADVVIFVPTTELQTDHFIPCTHARWVNTMQHKQM